MTNTEVIHNFYRAFAKANSEKMVGFYDAQAKFRDPALGELLGEEVKNMWRMLIQRSKGNLKITYGNVKADEKSGSAQWKAEYTFGPSGRKVINNITAEFQFRDGKIIRHHDTFNLWGWSRQALGWKGWILGWTPFMRRQIQKQSRSLLERWRSPQ